MGGKGRSAPPPEPIDPGESMGEYLFGRGFGQFRGITDPRLQQRLLSAERTFRPQYTALELADIATMARGLGEEEVENPRYTQTQDRISELQAELASTPTNITTQIKPVGRGFTRTEERPNPRRAELEREIASQQRTLEGISPTITRSKTPGLFDLLEESSEKAFELQQAQLRDQREADVRALEDFAPRAVEAYRAADPASTAIAEQMSRRAMGQLTPEEERNIQQRSRQASLARGRIGDSSSLAAEALGRSTYTAQFAPQAFAMNRQLAGDLGSTLLGRPSAAIGLGGQVLGAAQAGAAQPVGPQLFDPNVGINLALQQRGQDVTYQGMMAQADAARSAGLLGAVGQIGAAAVMPTPTCWVAREVYGIENPKWLQFRYWMLNDAPSWFRNLYIKYGERIANFISNKPRIKSIIRKWMNTKIK